MINVTIIAQHVKRVAFLLLSQQESLFQGSCDNQLENLL